jgi:hypothetical protein
MQVLKEKYDLKYFFKWIDKVAEIKREVNLFFEIFSLFRLLKWQA